MIDHVCLNLHQLARADSNKFAFAAHVVIKLYGATLTFEKLAVLGMWSLSLTSCCSSFFCTGFSNLATHGNTRLTMLSMFFSIVSAVSLNAAAKAPLDVEVFFFAQKSTNASRSRTPEESSVESIKYI